MKPCPDCLGQGVITFQVPHYDLITREMALDAEDYELLSVGQEVQNGYDEDVQPCPRCEGSGSLPENQELGQNQP